MRKVFLFMSAFIIINSSYAQVRFGLKAGGNLANMDGFDQSEMRLGISAGPALQVNLAKMFFLQSELLYSVKGRQSNTAQNNSNATLSLNYINLPVLIGYRLAPNFSIKLGPEIGRLLSAKSKFNGSTTDVNNIYQDFDLGADLALAYAFKKLSLDMRYNYGLKDLIQGQFEDPNGNFIQNESFGSNRVLQFSICYFFK